MINYWLLLIPVLTALTGWAVIRILSWSIFRPLKPAYLEQLAGGAGRFVQEEFHWEEVTKKTSDPALFETIRPMVVTHIDEFLRHKLKEQMPMISMFIGDKTIQTLQAIFIKEIEELFPQVMGRFALNLQERLDLSELVRGKIAALPPDRLTNLLRQGLARPLNRAAWMAGLFGLLIGIIQLVLVLLVK